MPKKDTQKELRARLKENLECIDDYAKDIQKNLILLDLVSTTKSRKHRALLLRLCQQNVNSHFDEVKLLVYGSEKMLSKLEEET